jgi:hypothetical protein
VKSVGARQEAENHGGGRGVHGLKKKERSSLKACGRLEVRGKVGGERGRD